MTPTRHAALLAVVVLIVGCTEHPHDPPPEPTDVWLTLPVERRHAFDDRWPDGDHALAFVTPSGVTYVAGPSRLLTDPRVHQAGDVVWVRIPAYLTDPTPEDRKETP